MYVWELLLTLRNTVGVVTRREKVTILGVVSLRCSWNIQGSWSIADGHTGMEAGLKSGLVINLQFIDLLVLEIMVRPVSWDFPRKSISLVRQRAHEQALRNSIISSPIQQKVLHEKQKELPVVGINTVRSGRKVPVAGCSTFSVSSRGHTSTDKSPLDLAILMSE